jgi:two-component system LytT family sensor kinase
VELGYARPWVWAVLLLPVATSLPWIYRKLGQWLDHVWLGRHFTVVEAVKSFLSRLQRATTEEALVAEAGAGLGEIFDAEARVDLAEPRHAGQAAEPESVVDVPVRSGARQLGRIHMGARADHRPYLSQDLELLRSLADVFSYMLENIRLQRKKQEQEQRAQELSLQASRTELKALRAQINPHFLFNALNVIAGLIHDDPARADATVEQLAEVFRYTLRDSEKEWAPLEAELEFVRAYLSVEQARFGERLAVSFDVEERVLPLRIPTMIVQTLVENAVKHGVAPLTDSGRIEISARREGGRLVVEVADNGTGSPPGARPGRAARRAARSAGYGLKNVRERLAGHFDDRARLSLERDREREMTVARIEIPWDAERGVA